MSRTEPGRPMRLLLTCEHAGNRIPAEHRSLFAGAEKALASHRGWDPGALPLARLIAGRLKLPLLDVRWSRLLVESNRSPHNPRIWSSFTAGLPREAKRRILERYWWPHRREVEDALSRLLGAPGPVFHLAVHSFTPELDGEVRNADVTFLYDSARPRERAACRRWASALSDLAPELRIRFNYPYLGSADGLTSWLRRRHPATRYLGVELEANQALLARPGWRRTGGALAESLRRMLEGRG